MLSQLYSFQELFVKGGLAMYPLLLCSLIGVYIIVQKFIYLMFNNVDKDLLNEKIKHALKNNFNDAINELSQENNVLARVITDSIKIASDDQFENIEDSVKISLLKEIPKLEKNMTILSSLITISPILGLLGTILGLMQIFNVISGGPVLNNPSLLAAGIAQALITTVTGLTIAIPFIFFHQYLNQKIEEYIISTERSAYEILYYYRSLFPKNIKNPMKSEKNIKNNSVLSLEELSI